MCLATVYAEKASDDSKVVVLDKVQFVDVRDDEVACTNLFGEVVKVQGRITFVDLADSKIMLEVD